KGFCFYRIICNRKCSYICDYQNQIIKIIVASLLLVFSLHSFSQSSFRPQKKAARSGRQGREAAALEPYSQVDHLVHLLSFAPFIILSFRPQKKAARPGRQGREAAAA